MDDLQLACFYEYLYVQGGPIFSATVIINRVGEETPQGHLLSQMSSSITKARILNHPFKVHFFVIQD